MELLLQRAELWDVVDGEGDQISPATAPQALALWKQKDLAAKMEIIVHLGDRQVQLVRSLPTSNAIWKLLRSTYKHTDLVSQVTLLKRLVNLVMSEGQQASQFIEDWQKVLDDAAIAGLVIPEKLQCMLLLAALPSSWRAFITTQSSSSKLQLQSLLAKIILENDLHHNTSSVKPLAMATTIHKSANYHRQQKPGRHSPTSFTSSPSRSLPHKPNNSRYPHKPSPPYNPSFTCTFCNRVGHLERDCRTKRRNQSQNPPKHQANTTTLDDLYILDEPPLCLFAASLDSKANPPNMDL